MQHVIERARAVGATLLVLATVAAAGACRDITSLDQINLSQLDAGTVYQPDNAKLLVNGSVGDFECAYTRYVTATGMFTDEMRNAIARIENYDYDRRTVVGTSPYGTTDCTSIQFPGVYTPLSVARTSGDTVVSKLQGWTDAQVPGRTQLIGRASAYTGYSLVLLGEAMCSAAINIGPEIQPAELFAQAKLRFDAAVTAATQANDATTLNLARLGRARAQLDLGNKAAAAADAALIPDGFIVNFAPDAVDPRRQNLLYVHMGQNALSSVDTSVMNAYDATKDPRIAYTSTGLTGTNGQTKVAYANKAATVTAPIALAKWSEAQLIIAENMVATGNLGGAAGIINVLRTRAGTTAYDATGATAAQVLAQIVEERRREFFLEGHRVGDVRRYGVTLNPAPGAAYMNGGVYGDQKCFPLPDVERINNPNIGKP